MPIGSYRLNSLAHTIASQIFPTVTLSYVGENNIYNNSSTVGTITTPAYQTGDIIILFDGASAGGSTTLPTSVIPSGYTQITTASLTTSPATRIIVSYQIATSSSSGATLTGMTGTAYISSGGNIKFVFVYRPSVSAVVSFGIPSASISASVASQTLTMSGLNRPFVGFGYWSEGGTTQISTRGSTVTATREITQTVSTFVYGAVKTFEALTSATTFANSILNYSGGGNEGLASFVMNVWPNTIATGGTQSVYQDGGTGYVYMVHTFAAVGTTNFVVNSNTTVDILVVGGGGGGGGLANITYSVAGAGTGAFVTYQTGINLTPQTYSIVVGAGGTGGTASSTVGGNGGNGGTSSGLGYSAAGGYGGPGVSSSGKVLNGSNGAGSAASLAVAGTGSAGTYPYAGGNGYANTGGTVQAGGGAAGFGGAGSNGSITGGTNGAGGNGGLGVNYNITGSTVMYASGGGGSISTITGTVGDEYQSNGFIGIGANNGSGQTSSGGYGGNNTTGPYGGGGGAGGGNGSTGSATVGFTGRQGVVIIRYRIA